MSGDVVQIPRRPGEPVIASSSNGGTLFHPGPLKTVIHLPDTESVAVIVRGVRHFGDDVEILGDAHVRYRAIVPGSQKKFLHVQTRSAVRLI